MCSMGALKHFSKLGACRARLQIFQGKRNVKKLIVKKPAHRRNAKFGDLKRDVSPCSPASYCIRLNINQRVEPAQK